MRKRQATVIINQLFDKLETADPNNLSHWKIEARSIAESIFGKDSHEYKSLGQFYVDNNYASDAEKMYDKIKETNSLKSLRNIFLKAITVKGVYRKPKENSLSKITEGWLIFWAGLLVFGVIPMTFYIGYWAGEHSLSTTPSATNQKIEKTTNYTKDNIKNKEVR